MKEKSFGSDCIYPSIFKDYFLEAIYESGYKDKVVYKDLDNLSINLYDIKVNMYSINIFLGTIFKHYKKAKFNVLQVKKIYHTKDYQLYNVKIAISYKCSKWLMNLNVGNALNKSTDKKDESYILKGIKRKISIKLYTQEERLADLFYRITNNLYTKASDLYNLYILYYGDINVYDLGAALENLYKCISNNIDFDTINKKIIKLNFSKSLKGKWIIFKNMNDNINIEYEDIMCSLYLILLKFKERKIKSLKK